MSAVFVIRIIQAYYRYLSLLLFSMVRPNTKTKADFNENSEVLAHKYFNHFFFSADVTSEISINLSNFFFRILKTY